jgi:hypothetical protein
MPIFRTWSLLLIVFYSAAFPQAKADFLILPQPKNFKILNQYQQPLSPAEAEQFRPFAPLQVVNADELQSDQITRTMRVQFNGAVYFLLKDDQGNLTGGRPETYRSCTALDDTVEVGKGRAVWFSDKFPAKGKGEQLGSGSVLARIFQYRDHYYVRQAGLRPRFGWCYAGQKDAWQAKKQPEKAVEPAWNSAFCGRLTARMDAANEAYRKYFEYFNQSTGEEKAIPRWKCSCSEGSFTATLGSPYQGTDQLRESTQYLVRDLENILLGKPFIVIEENGVISIKPK